MSRLKYLFIIFVIFIHIIVSLNSLSYAASKPITEENLNNALQNFASSTNNANDYEIDMSNGEIAIKDNEKKYIVNYDLTNNPKFTISIPIKQGMTYDEFNEQVDKLYLTTIGYIGVANVQGVDIQNAGLYLAMCILSNAFSDMSSSSAKYFIATDGTTVESNDLKVIYESDFGNHVMEYVNSIYSTKQTYSDSAENKGFNTFTWTTEETDITSTSCNLVSTITVNLDADFSKLKEYANSFSTDNDITEQTADYVVKLKVGQKCQIQSSKRIVGYHLEGNQVEFDRDFKVITAIYDGITTGYLYIENMDNQKSIYISVEKNNENSTLEPVILNLDNVTTNNANKNENDEKDNNEKNSNSGETTEKNNNSSKNDNDTKEKNNENGILDSLISELDNETTNNDNKNSNNEKNSNSVETTKKNNNSSKTENVTNKKNNDNTISVTTLPKTGQGIVIFGIIAIVGIMGVVGITKYNKYKDVK